MANPPNEKSLYAWITTWRRGTLKGHLNCFGQQQEINIHYVILLRLCYLLFGGFNSNNLPIQDFLTWFLDHIKLCPAIGPLNTFSPLEMVIHLLLIWLISFHFPVISLKPRSILGCSITLKKPVFFFHKCKICIVYFLHCNRKL